MLDQCYNFASILNRVDIVSDAQHHQTSHRFIGLPSFTCACMQLNKLVVIQVTSLLNNQKSLPKGSRPSDRMVGEYEAILQQLKTVRSEYVTIREPPQQPASTATPSQALGRGINNHPYTF